jgi:hypothetical protein
MSHTSSTNKKTAAPQAGGDALPRDEPLNGQEYCVMSFLSPEKIIKQRDIFMFEQFVKQWELKKSMDTFSSFLHFLSYKHSIDMSGITADYENFVKEEEAKIKEISITTQYNYFIEKNKKELERNYEIKNRFQTSVRGFKNSGNFATLEEAQLRAEIVRDKDPRFSALVGLVGQWGPWEPDAYESGKTHHMNDDLNKLAQEKDKNDAIAKSTFDARVLAAKRAAIEENVRKAQASGNKLTQTIDDAGNLVGVNNTQETALRNSSSSSNSSHDSVASTHASAVRSAIFEGDTVMDTKGDHGLSTLTHNPFAPNSSSLN